MSSAACRRHQNHQLYLPPNRILLTQTIWFKTKVQTSTETHNSSNSEELKKLNKYYEHIQTTFIVTTQQVTYIEFMVYIHSR
jgi:hypothetical protein